MAKNKGTRRKVIFRRRYAGYEKFLYYLRRFGKYGAALVIVFWLAAWFVLLGGVDKIKNWSVQESLELTAKSGFVVRNILVEGREYTDPDILKGLINMEKGDPVFAFDPQEARKMIEKISWVKKARVERRLPDTIYVGLEERNPMALWQKDGRPVLVDDEGEILSEGNPVDFRGLIMVYGRDAPQNAGELLELLAAEPELKQQVRSAARISGRRWNLRLENGIKILLPEKDMGLALRRMMQAHEEGSLLDKDIVNIDLRKADRLIVRPRKGRAHTWQSGGQSGI